MCLFCSFRAALGHKGLCSQLPCRPVARGARGVEPEGTFSGASRAERSRDVPSRQRKKRVRAAGGRAVKGTLGQGSGTAGNLQILVLHVAFTGEETRDAPAPNSCFVVGN